VGRARVRAYPIPTRHFPRSQRPRQPSRVPHSASAWAGLALLVLVIVSVTLGPALLRQAPDAVAPEEALRGPSAGHLLGTDAFGRDVMSRLLHGGRLSLAAGATAVALAAVAGSLLGILAGYAGGAIDLVVSWLADMLLSFPGLLLALVLAWLFGRDMGKAALAVAVASAPLYVRLARSGVRRVRRAPYVRAAEAVGVGHGRILLRHILPNVAGPLLAVGLLDLGWAVLHVSALSFLGVGARPPQPEWGAMLSEARGYVRQAPWLGLAPGAAIAITVLSVNLLGEAWQEALDPLRARRP